MSGEVGHFSLPADNLERARKFYSATFGWKMIEAPGSDTTMVSTGTTDERGMPKGPGYIGGSLGKRGDHLTQPVVWIIVDDIVASEHSIEQHGGKILQRKRPIGDGSMGHTGYFQDSEGNVVALYQTGTVAAGSST